MRRPYFVMLKTLRTTLKDLFDSVAPGTERVAAREAGELQNACCALLSEVARLDDANAERKRAAVAQAMREQFPLDDATLPALLDAASHRENRLTSYYKPVKLLNEAFSPERKAKLVEQLWRVAMIDGDIDHYEDHLVRKISDLLYVPHVDFILAKNRVQASVL